MVINLYEYYGKIRKRIGRDALYLMEFALDVDKSEILADKKLEVSEDVINLLEQMVVRREKGEPLQYIKGECEFYGLNFKVGEGVLVPRADTEISVETVLGVCGENAKIADLCSGSGCIAISVKKNKPSAEVCAYELSDKALEYLKENAKQNGADINIIKADVTCPTDDNTEFDIVVANPPYLTKEDMNELQTEVKFEPETALFGGDDGLDFYRDITRVWSDKIKDNGYLIYEIGINQQKDVAEIMKNYGFCDIEEIKDLSGIIRVIKGKRRKN